MSQERQDREAEAENDVSPSLEEVLAGAKAFG